MKLRKRGKTWHIDGTTPDGRRIRRSLRTTSKTEARRLAAALSAELLALPPEAYQARRADPRALLEEYLASWASLDPARNPARLRRQVLPLLPRRKLEACTPPLLGRILRDRAAARNWKPGTYNFHRARLSAFFGWLTKQGYLARNPVLSVPRLPDRSPPPRRALTREEAARLLAAAPLPRRVRYGLALGAGLRAREIRLLEWRDVDLAGATLSLRAETTKNRRPALLPLPAWLVGLLSRWRPLAGPVRVSRGNTHHETWNKDREAAGIPYKTPAGRVDFHALRVTYATSLARAGVSVAHAQRLLRHQDPRLTLSIYTRLDAQDLRQAVDKLPDSMNLRC